MVTAYEGGWGHHQHGIGAAFGSLVALGESLSQRLGLDAAQQVRFCTQRPASRGNQRLAFAWHQVRSLARRAAQHESLHTKAGQCAQVVSVGVCVDRPIVSEGCDQRGDDLGRGPHYPHLVWKNSPRGRSIRS